MQVASITKYSMTFAGQSCRKGLRPMWDAVVITTADEVQKEAFRLQVDDKIARKELPLDLPIHLVSDPPGFKIGKANVYMAVHVCCVHMTAKKLHVCN